MDISRRDFIEIDLEPLEMFFYDIFYNAINETLLIHSLDILNISAIQKKDFKYFSVDSGGDFGQKALSIYNFGCLRNDSYIWLRMYNLSGSKIIHSKEMKILYFKMCMNFIL